jgi:hypothetical protein
MTVEMSVRITLALIYILCSTYNKKKLLLNNTYIVSTYNKYIDYIRVLEMVDSANLSFADIMS